jgi:glycosyltransferase involved in cell wall biosynthesis
VSEVVFLSERARPRVIHEAPFMSAAQNTTIHEGVDTEVFAPSPNAGLEFRRRHNIGPRPFVLAVGALSEEKCYPLLLDALARLDDRAPLLVVCGEGGDESALRAYAEALRVRVKFVGRVPREQLVGAYAAATALVHTGDRETFGLAVLEAMACARPVVVSSGGALPEVVGETGGAGVIVSGGAAEWSEAIASVLGEPWSRARMGAAGRRRAVERFSLAAMARGYAEVVARAVTPAERR